MNNVLFELAKAEGFESFKRRRELAIKYSWAIPNDDALNFMSEYGPWIEMGSGTGYWSALLQDRGVDITPCEKYIDDNPYKHSKAWTELFPADSEALKIAPKKYNLFLCWPPYDEPMAYECLMSFRGEYVCYIGEGHGGCTADDAFHEELDRNWCLEDIVDLPQWNGVYDSLYIYKRSQ